MIGKMKAGGNRRARDHFRKAGINYLDIPEKYAHPAARQYAQILEDEVHHMIRSATAPAEIPRLESAANHPQSTDKSDTMSGELGVGENMHKKDGNV